MTNNEKNDHRNNDRDCIVDFIRGIAVFFMVLGHCIQYGSGTCVSSTGAFLNDYLFKFMYSFHMPLFMFLSGYVFFY